MKLRRPDVWNTTPVVLESKGEIFHLRSKHTRKHEAIMKSEKIKRDGYRVRNKYLNIKGKNLYLIYQGNRRGKNVKRKKR